jgi:tyrosinase
LDIPITSLLSYINKNTNEIKISFNSFWIYLKHLLLIFGEIMAITIRKNLDTLTNDEWDRFVYALNKLKNTPVFDTDLNINTNRYDQITQHHAKAQATPTLMPGETGTLRNVAHRGPAFFPWHRQALRELEIALINIQLVDIPAAVPVGIPYYRWNVDTANWRTHAVWSRIGGNGDPNNGFLINTGPFRNWTSTIRTATGAFRSRPGIVRKFAATANMPAWGNTSVLTYDSAPWREDSSITTSFRTFMEQKHDRVHTLIGGDMTAFTSPNDPVFWFHHSNVDRAWSRWQSARGLNNFQPNVPIFDGAGRPVTPSQALSFIYNAAGDSLPQGHHLNSVPRELGSSRKLKTNGEMLDRLNFDLDANGNFISNSGFTYDTLNA